MHSYYWLLQHSEVGDSESHVRNWLLPLMRLPFLHLLLCGDFYYHFDGDDHISDDYGVGDHISVSPSFVVISFAASSLKTHSLNMYLMWFRGFIKSILYKYLFFFI